MAKRYTDTGLYEREWFQKLNPKFKCFWDYICKKCDHAGIWNTNYSLASYQIGAKITKEEIKETFGDKIVFIENDKTYIPGFVKFQYGITLKEENRVHKSVIEILERYDLIGKNGIIKGHASIIDGSHEHHSNTVKDGQMNSKKKKSTLVKRFKIPTQKEVIEYFEERGYDSPTHEGKKFWNFYESKGWVVGKAKMKNWHSSASNWNSDNAKGSKQKINERAYIEKDQKEKKHGW